MKLFVTTLALAAAVSNGAKLRSSIQSNAAMQEFMAIYGDQVSTAKDFHHDPQKALKRFIKEQKARTLKEHQDSMEGGKKKCTTDHKAKVTLNTLFGDEEPTLEGCMPDSTCAKDANEIVERRNRARRCVLKTKLEMNGKSHSLAKKVEDLDAVLRKEKEAFIEREKQRSSYKKLVAENNEAVELLKQVKANIENGSDKPLLPKMDQETLSRVAVSEKFMSLLEVEGSTRSKRLLKLVDEFIAAIMAHTKELESGEAKEAANYAKMVKVYSDRKNDATEIIDSAKESKSEIFAKYRECKTSFATAKQDFEGVYEKCKLHQEQFSQTSQDNMHIMKIMNQVYTLIHTHLGWNTATGPSAATAATGSASSGITGASKTGSTGATASTGASESSLGATRL